MGSDGGEDQRRHTAVTSQNGCLKAWSESRGTHWIVLDGEDWYYVPHGRLIFTPDGIAKEEVLTYHPHRSGLFFRFYQEHWSGHGLAQV